MTNSNPGPTPIRHFDVELVDEAPQPKKAPPPRAAWEQGNGAEDLGGRPTAYLHDFLHEGEPGGREPDGHDMNEQQPATPDEALREEITLALRDIYDPEIPVNIYDLGLIYDISVEDGHIGIVMTLTTPNCPVAESMPGEVELRVMAVPGVATCDVNLVWDPPWNPSHMTDEAKLELGML